METWRRLKVTEVRGEEDNRGKKEKGVGKEHV